MLAQLLALALWGGMLREGDLPAPPPQAPDPVWAIDAALADANSLDHTTRSTCRWVWLRDGDTKTLAALTMVVNESLNRTNVPVSPLLEPVGAMTVLHGGRLVRLNLAVLADDEKELANLLTIWDKMVDSEPDFTADIPGFVKVKAPRYWHEKDQRYYSVKWVKGNVRATSPFVLQQGVQLRQVTGSAVAIVDARELMKLATTNLEGGLYYEFRGLEPTLTLANYLRRVGVKEEHAAAFDPPNKALSSETIDKAAVIKSEVTGKGRMIVLLPATNQRLTQGTPMVSITFDVFDENRDPRSSALHNLVTMKADGFEVIATKEDGTHEYTIWDATGKLVRVAPPNLVSDDDIPRAHGKNLQPGMSCIRCHGPEDGWKGFTNAVPLIMEAGIDALVDQSGTNPTTLRGMYSGDWFGILGPSTQSRAQYADVMLRSTGWIPQDENSSAAIEVSRMYSQIYGRYVYDELGPVEVCWELGIGVKDEADAIAALSALSNKPIPNLVVQDDPLLRALLKGLKMGRRDFNAVKAALLYRVHVEQRGTKP